MNVPPEHELLDSSGRCVSHARRKVDLQAEAGTGLCASWPGLAHRPRPRCTGRPGACARRSLASHLPPARHKTAVEPARHHRQAPRLRHAPLDTLPIDAQADPPQPFLPSHAWQTHHRTDSPIGNGLQPALLIRGKLRSVENRLGKFAGNTVACRTLGMTGKKRDLRGHHGGAPHHRLAGGEEIAIHNSEHFPGQTSHPFERQRTIGGSEHPDFSARGIPPGSTYPPLLPHHFVSGHEAGGHGKALHAIAGGSNPRLQQRAHATERSTDQKRSDHPPQKGRARGALMATVPHHRRGPLGYRSVRGPAPPATRSRYRSSGLARRPPGAQSRL